MTFFTFSTYYDFFDILYYDFFLITLACAHRSVSCVVQVRQAELEAARLAKEKEEEEAKQAAQQAKKEKEIQKKAIKKERQKLRTTCKVRLHRSSLMVSNLKSF